MAGEITPIESYFVQSGTTANAVHTDDISVAKYGATHLLLAAQVTGTDGSSEPNTPISLYIEGKYSTSQTVYYNPAVTEDPVNVGLIRHRWGPYTATILQGSAASSVGGASHGPSRLIATFKPITTLGLGGSFPRQWEPYPIYPFQIVRFEFFLSTTLNDIGLELTPILIRLPWGG